MVCEVKPLGGGRIGLIPRRQVKSVNVGDLLNWCAAARVVELRPGSEVVTLDELSRIGGL